MRETDQVESLKSVVDRFPKMLMKSWVVHEKETHHLLLLGGHESKPRWRAHNPHPQGDSEKKTSHDKHYQGRGNLEHSLTAGGSVKWDVCFEK